MKKTLIYLLIACFCLLSLPIWVKAQEATDDITSAVKAEADNIEQLREEIQKQVQEKLDSIINEEKKVGWIGQITKKAETGFTISFNGAERTITLGSEITIIGSSRQETTFDNLAEEDNVLVLGYLQIDGSLDARRIIVSADFEPNETKAVFGKINDKSAETNVLLASCKDGSEYEVIISKTTSLRKRDGDKKIKISYEDIEPGQNMIAIIKPSESNGSTYNAVEIIVLSPTTEETPAEG